MSRIWTRASVRVFAVFVLVVGLVAGGYLGIHRMRQSTTPQTIEVVGDPVDPVVEQRRQHDAVDGYRRQRMHREASRDASRSARRKADAGGANASDVANNADDAKEKADAKKAHEDDGDSGGSGPVGPVPDSCKDYSGNRATGCTLMLDAGFKIDQMTCLDKLWTRESGWNPHAANPSGAYGIPQAKPGSKMASVGDDWQDNPATQIKWGLGYIKSHYSTPCGAWQHSENTGWY